MVKLLDKMAWLDLDRESLLNVVYQYIREQKLHHHLLGSSYFLQFVTYLVESDDIDDLVASAVRANR